MDDEEIRTAWDTESLRGLWAKAREVLEAPEQPPTFRLELPDETTREAVGTLYGRPMWGMGTRISVSKLDSQLREVSGNGLERVLEILHGRPVTRASSTPAEPQPADPVHSALSEHGIDEKHWSQPWIQWFHQFGRVAGNELDVIAGRAAAVLAEVALDRAPESWTSRAELATRHGDPHQLDDGTTLSRVVLRAMALAHEVEPPGNERDRRALWERCGVTLDAVSATVLCWALPLTASELSPMLRQRTSLGLPTHLTHLDLRLAPEQLVEAGTAVAVCENPRVLEAAAQERIEHPLVCLSGHPTTVAASLLDRLAASGAALHLHTDMDWTGVRIAGSLWANRGVRPWRMSAADYRESLNLASAERTDLATLVGSPVDTPWDPGLSELMSTAGRAIEEETVLPTLLSDLRAGLR